MKSVTKAIIPAAGLGTRMLPATKALPKEMLTLIDRPIIELAVEDAVCSGCTDILIITSRGKGTIEDHFDRAPELEAVLERRGKLDLLQRVQFLRDKVKVSYIRQAEALGLGQAVLMAQAFVGNEPFAILLPDDLVVSPTPSIRQLIEVYAQTGKSVLGTTVVPISAISKYGCIKRRDTAHTNPYLISDVVEKPEPHHAPSDHAIVGRYLLTSSIFSHLAALTAGQAGEYQLTDAIRSMVQVEDVYALAIAGMRYDLGDKLGLLQAAIAIGLSREDIGPDLREWLHSHVW